MSRDFPYPSIANCQNERTVAGYGNCYKQERKDGYSVSWSQLTFKIIRL